MSTLIKLINGFGFPCVVLAKGILLDSLAKLSDANTCGITLVSLDESFRERMEPGAANLLKMVGALRTLHDAGCKTWVSMEPYPTPNVCEQKLMPILEADSFVDRIVFGRTHYDKLTSRYMNHGAFYLDAVARARGFCEERSTSCYIKTRTADYSVSGCDSGFATASRPESIGLRADFFVSTIQK
ncbi:hypothetical protein [Caniella muris]|uniref:hypothetical protein n=1 Tax=Caniella muris TaxID=2941502 RepID=UPI00203F81F3|nr:hypothetical protein [Caniella muris]